MEKIIIQPDLCDGCLDCQDACSQLYGTSRILVREVEGSFYPIICQQCEDAPCANVCPVDAIVIEDNLAVIDQLKCIHCGKCIEVCPTNAIREGLLGGPEETSA